MRQLRKEIGKLVALAQSAGVKVFFHTGSSDAMEGLFDDRADTIHIYSKKPLRQYFSLCHELGHLRGFIKDGRVVPGKIDKAYHKDYNLESGEILDKKYRKIIYETEKRDAKNQLDIHFETKSTVPLWMLKREIEYDLWIYKVYYKTGKVPSRKEAKEMRKSLTKKWKNGRVK